MKRREKKAIYWLLHLGLLLTEGSSSIRPFLLAMLDPLLTDPWQQMSRWFESDDVNPFNTTHGMTLWEQAGQEPKLNQLFNEAMASDARLVTSVILDHCRGVFEGLGSVIDVGGGTGVVARAIEAFPDIRCISFDLPHVFKGLVGSKNLCYVGGDMFEAIPLADANCSRKQWILHDWNDEECVKILKLCREAIPSKEHGGKLIIIDIVMEVHEGENDLLDTQLFFFDMVMMILVTGRKMTEKDWEKLFFNAAFSDYKITSNLSLGCLSLTKL